MRTFGGIWKDFAVERPGQDCFGMVGKLIVLDGKDGDVWLWDNVPGWVDGVVPGRYFWLDRRVPKSLTAKQAFDIMSVLYPGATAISKLDDVGRYTRVHPDVDPIDIEWDGLTIYSPPGNGEWVEVTKENWLTYLHKPCRCGKSQNYDAHLVGISPRGELIVLFHGGGLAFESVVRVQVSEKK